MNLEITRALPADTASVASILEEVVEWLRSSGKGMWRPDEVSFRRVAPDVSAGLFYLARVDGQPQGTVKFQLTDVTFWPEVTNDDSAFVHRLAVRRGFAGSGLSNAILDWAVERAASLGRQFLRLDCDPRRVKLRRFYEDYGFQLHSETELGGFKLARYELGLPFERRRTVVADSAVERMEV